VTPQAPTKSSLTLAFRCGYTGGKATGVYRQYQVECRDVLLFRDKQLTPWSGDGIDVPFDLPDTRWTFDIALRDQAGSPLLAECRRTVGAVKQEDVAAFAYKVEMVRKTLDIPVAGVFFTKREHQIGAVKVSQFQGIEAAIMDPGSVPPGFNITFLRYNSEREKKRREIIMHVSTGSFAMTGSPIIATVTRGKTSGESEGR
jgi:hypothetical protein